MNTSFLQSLAWEEFQKKIGNKTFRVNDALVIKNSLILNQSYLYCPRVEFKNIDELERFLNKVDALAKQEQTFFVRIEPEKCQLSDKDIVEYDLKKVTSRQPKQTLMVKLDLKKDKLLSNMKQKTRYNIKLAKRKGVEIRSGYDPKMIKSFYDIAEVTAKRDKIKFHSLDYYQKMGKLLGKHRMFLVYNAYYKKELLASMIVIDWKETRTYLFGASSNKYRNLMAPYLLQWQAMLDGKKRAKKYYDFWGIAPIEIEKNKYQVVDEKHEWAGISRFKLGFAPDGKNGIYIEYPSCFEKSYGKKRYFLYSMFKKVM